MKKVAIIIVNYNMPERTDSLVETLKKNTKHPHDIIVVDNASDLTDISKYTSILLTQNVQTTNGWLTGLAYADALEATFGIPYFAYCFVITSTAIRTDKDMITGMIEIMSSNDDIVGVHPALTSNSTTHWKQMITDGSDSNIYKVGIIDNIFSCYRADWFNSIGRFDRAQTFAWGIDAETCYRARTEKKQILLDNRFLVEKITDIGYTMNRMNMMGATRKQLAYQQMIKILTEKYGDYESKLFGKHSHYKELYQPKN